MTNSTFLNSKTATWTIWFKTAKSAPVARYLLDKCGDNGYSMSITGSSKDAKNKDKLCVTVNGHSCLSDSNVTDDEWHHAAATYDGENLKLFVDGQRQKQVVSWKGEITANTNCLIIGMNKSNPTPEEKDQSFDGIIDNLMIFNHGITDDEVKPVLAAAKPKFTKGQVAGRIRELDVLYDRGLLLKDFYDRKIAECEVTVP